MIWSPTTYILFTGAISTNTQGRSILSHHSTVIIWSRIRIIHYCNLYHLLYTSDTSITFAGFMVSHLFACRKGHGRRQSGGWGEKRPSRFPRALNEQFVHDNKSRHSFDDRNGTWNDTGVVTTPGGKCTWGAIILGRFLRLRYGRGGFKSDAMIRDERLIHHRLR